MVWCYSWTDGTKLMTLWLRFFEAVATKTSAKSDIVNLPHWTCLHHLETMLVHFKLTRLMTKGFCEWSWRHRLPSILSGWFCFTALRPFNRSILLVHSLALRFLHCSSPFKPRYLRLYRSTIILQLALNVDGHYLNTVPALLDCNTIVNQD